MTCSSSAAPRTSASFRTLDQVALTSMRGSSRVCGLLLVVVACAVALGCRMRFLSVLSETYVTRWPLEHLWPTVNPSGDEAYAFMLYGDFPGRSVRLYECCTGLLVAVHSIRKFDQRRPIILLTTAPPIEERALLDRLGVETREVSLVRGPNTTECRKRLGRKKMRLLDSYTKLHVWELTGFRTVLYLEFDTLVLASLDMLFQKLGSSVLGIAPQGSKKCAKDWSLWPGRVKGNTGVMVVRPSTDFALKYAHAVSNRTFSCHTGSQDLENQLFNEAFFGDDSNSSRPLCLPGGHFNCRSTRCLKTASLLHWSGERKPWDGAKGWRQAYPLWKSAREDLLSFDEKR